MKSLSSYTTAACLARPFGMGPWISELIPVMIFEVEDYNVGEVFAMFVLSTVHDQFVALVK